MNITGGMFVGNIQDNDSKGSTSGAFTKTNVTGAQGARFTSNMGAQYTFTASRSWTGATSSNGEHTHTLTTSTLTLTDSGLFGLSDTVQPNALKCRVKTRFI